MTNTPNSKNNQQEEICTACSAYQYFLTLVEKTNTPIEEAFHDAVGFIMEHIAEEIDSRISEDSYQMGFADGHLSAYEVIAEGIGNARDKIESVIDGNICGDCDCETDCAAGLDFESTNSNDGNSAESMIRRSIRDKR
jgi:hypothetical protein